MASEDYCSTTNVTMLVDVTTGMETCVPSKVLATKARAPPIDISTKDDDGFPIESPGISKSSARRLDSPASPMCPTPKSRSIGYSTSKTTSGFLADDIQTPRRVKSMLTSAMRRVFASSKKGAQCEPVALHRAAVTGDGNCLFRAIARNYAHMDSSKEGDEKAEQLHADTLRHMAWNEVCIERREELQARKVIDSSIVEHVAFSRFRGVGGGEAEILALADALQVCIKVYVEETAVGEYRCVAAYGELYQQLQRKLKAGDGTVRLLLVNENHYDALLLA